MDSTATSGSVAQRQRTYAYGPFIERDAQEYSLHLLVDELRQEARTSWRVMHEFRKEAAQALTLEDRCNANRCAGRVRAQLITTLGFLNAGLGRKGSYHGASLRRLDRDIAEFKARELGRVA